MLTSNHTISPIGYNFNNSSRSPSQNSHEKSTSISSSMSSSTLNQSNGMTTPKLPSIHHLTNGVAAFERTTPPKKDQFHMSQQQKSPIHTTTLLPAPLAPSSHSNFEQNHNSTAAQPQFPYVVSQSNQLHHQLRSPVNKQYVFTQNSPTSPISPILLPYSAVQRGAHSFSPPSYPVAYTSPQPQFNASYPSSNSPVQLLPLSLPLHPQHIVTTPKASQQASYPSDSVDANVEIKGTSAKITKPVGKSLKRKRRPKSANNGSHDPKSHSKSGSSIHNRKPRQTLVFNEDAIHYPVHRDLSQLINSNKIPSSVVQQLNTTIYPQIDTKKYSTSALDPQRNFLTVFEYMVNDHWIIWDYETGFVHLTGIWKASLNVEGSAPPSASHLKADIVKLLESTPKQYQAYIKRIRGGFLKIQGTWLPYKLCKILARRFCYHIRFALIPIFGADFPESCLHPHDSGYGELKLDDLKYFEEQDLPEPVNNSNEDHHPQSPPSISSEMQQPRETETSAKSPSLVVQQQVQQQQSQLPFSDRSVGLASPVSISSGSSKFVDVEQLPPVGTFSPVSSRKPLTVGQYTNQCSPQPYEDQYLPLSTPNSHPHLAHDNPNSTSSESLNSIFSSKSTTQGTTHTKPQSQTDLLEIVNASKCLQSLSQERRGCGDGNARKFPVPGQQLYNHASRSSESIEDETDIEDDGSSNTRSTFKTGQNVMEDGISSILIAAEINKSNANNSKFRPSMSIKDLTT
ncbi:hypothetical protein CANMA_002040 [Candida margitis]|uniref:uncharacterized protein n=1 Tax=Candida margitis TaxID=1775924 RepID=UPI0022262985|nr:uncharacterized protein CANMA_002040 [Candida margitis]KAI5968866.1 hypothetical protein CANMA_002040 [Candida margitis]